MNHPSGFSTINRYNPQGYLSSIARGDTEQDIWRLEEMNPRGQIKRFALGNGLTTTQDYDEYGFLTGITTDPGIQSLSYDFDHATGNLSYRSDHKYNLTEEFDYDENLLDTRLTQCKINGTVSLSTNYQNNGNIDTKSDVGTYSYSALKPHALKTVDVPEPGFVDNSPLQQITYTAVGKVRTIRQDNPDSPNNPYLLNLYYGPDNQRIKTELFYGSTRIKTKIFGQAGYEYIVDEAGNKIQLHYLTSPSGVFAVYINVNGNESIYYLHTDHLGSLYAITGEDGRIVTQNGLEAVYSFDAWGRRRNPVNWSYEGLSGDLLIDRGFTFHEHLDEFGLINMNGRVYDPVIGRFLSPDNYIQGGITQSFNRYSYCRNNPLIYTDPDGEWINIVIGAAVGGVVGYISGRMAGLRGGELAIYTVASAAIGAVSSGIGTAAGSAVSVGTSAFVTGAVSGAVGGATGGLIAGTMTTSMNNIFFNRNDNVLEGGLIGAGFGAASGFIAGGIAGGIKNLNNDKRFFDGASVKKEILEQPIPCIGQEGDNNCLAAVVEATDKSYNGNITQQDVRNWMGGDPMTDPLKVSDTWNEYELRSLGSREVYNVPVERASQELTSVFKNDVRININIGEGKVGHSVILQKIVVKTITPTNGNSAFTRTFYYVMNPSNNGFYSRISMNINYIRSIYYIY